MPDDEAQQLIQKLLLQALSRRLPQAKWLSLLHQLVRRIEAAQDKDDAAGDIPSLAPAHAAGCLVRYILSQSFIDPLLIEYLQAVIYGSANRSGVTPDQGPVADVITVTLHLLANVEEAKANVLAIETISSIIGQGLLMTFQAPAPFRVADSSFLGLLQHLFARIEDENAASSSSSPADETGSTSQDGSIAPAALAFVVSNLKLLALAADPTISSPQNLLAPRVAITVLINVGQNLLAHVNQRLSTLQASKDPKFKPPSHILDRTRSAAKDSITEIEAVLQSMNPAWKDEIALLRSLTSQISVIDQHSEALSASSADSSIKARRKKAETMQDAQRRATWDHFLDTSSVSLSETKPLVEPEMAFLMHLLVDQHVAWEAKLDAVKTLFIARRSAAAPSLTLEKSLTAFYLELLTAAIEACATVVQLPPAFKGAEVYAAIWRNVLCGMVPEIVLQLEQWLDTRQDLPLRGERLEAPHVRLEAALRAALLVMADRLNVCETANQTSDAAGTEMMSDVVGLDIPPTQPIKAWLLRACIEHSLARPEAIADEFPEGHKLASEVQSLDQSLKMDAQLEGLNLNSLFESRVSTDDPMELLHRVASDPGTHLAFARQLVVQIQGWLEAHDLESVARWCKALSEDVTEGGAVLDTLMCYLDPQEVVEPLASVLDHQDVGQTSDEPSTLSNILLFLQLVCCRYSINPARIKRYAAPNNEMELEGSTAPQDVNSSPPFLATYLTTSSVCYRLSTLSEEERGLVGRWIHALFGNEGISDDLIQLSPPTLLLRLSPLLFSQSISACQHGLIDLETLRGGLSYFLQDLLSFALPGALIWLLGEITRVPVQPILDFLADSGLQASVVDVPSSDGTLANGLGRGASSITVHLEVLALLVDSDACPGSVRHVIAGAFDAFVGAVGAGMGELERGCETFRLASLRGRMEAAGATELFSRGGLGWLRTLADPKGDSGLVSLLCGLSGSSSGIDQLVQSLAAVGGKATTADQKAIAAWLCLASPSSEGSSGVHPVLKLVSKLELAGLEEGAIESVVRTVGLVLGLVRAAEAVRGSSGDGEERADVAAQILELANNVQSASAGADAGKAATAEATAGDLFDDEPNTPPLPPAAIGSASNPDLNGEAKQPGPTVAALLSSPAFNLTSGQILDLIALKLVRLKQASPRDSRVHAAKWATLESAILENLDTQPSATADASDEHARGAEKSLVELVTLLQQ